jgi:hypothetical protein
MCFIAAHALYKTFIQSLLTYFILSKHFSTLVVLPPPLYVFQGVNLQISSGFRLRGGRLAILTTGDILAARLEKLPLCFCPQQPVPYAIGLKQWLTKDLLRFPLPGRPLNHILPHTPLSSRTYLVQ